MGLISRVSSRTYRNSEMSSHTSQVEVSFDPISDSDFSEHTLVSTQSTRKSQKIKQSSDLELSDPEITTEELPSQTENDETPFKFNKRRSLNFAGISPVPK